MTEVNEGSPPRVASESKSDTENEKSDTIKTESNVASAAAELQVPPANEISSEVTTTDVKTIDGKAEEDSHSGEIDLYGYINKDFTSEIFKIEISNLPPYFGMKVFCPFFQSI